jgi:hypothetical protein
METMDDQRIIEFERALWVGEGDVYRRSVSPDCLMVVPEQPFLLRGEEAISSVEGTPRWSSVEFAHFEIKRPQEGLIVVGYRVEASRGEELYRAYCTSTYQRVGDHDWRVIQHQQTLLPAAHAEEARNGEEERSTSGEEQRGYQ